MFLRYTANLIKQAHALDHNARLESAKHNASWWIYEKAIEMYVSWALSKSFAPSDFGRVPAWIYRFGTLDKMHFMIFAPVLQCNFSFGISATSEWLAIGAPWVAVPKHDLIERERIASKASGRNGAFDRE